MQEAVLALLATWQTFYVLIGTAAATLLGLTFVVATLIAGVRCVHRRQVRRLQPSTRPTCGILA
jgi:hypothetical protein